MIQWLVRDKHKVIKLLQANSDTIVNKQWLIKDKNRVIKPL